MKEQITLETKEVRTVIAKFFGIREEQVIPQRYGFSIEGLTAAEIRKKLEA